MNRITLASLITLAACAPDLGGAARSGGAATPHPAKTVATSDALAPPSVPVPETLAFVADRFGLTMRADGWTWKSIRRDVTRFDWTGRPPSRDRELLYSFWMEKLDEQSAKLLPQIVGSAAANLAEGEPCRPFEQPAEIVKVVGVDRIVTVCFEPSAFYGKEFRFGVMHGLVKDGALTLAVALSNDRAAAVPIAAMIGASGKVDTH